MSSLLLARPEESIRMFERCISSKLIALDVANVGNVEETGDTSRRPAPTSKHNSLSGVQDVLVRHHTKTGGLRAPDASTLSRHREQLEGRKRFNDDNGELSVSNVPVVVPMFAYPLLLPAKGDAISELPVSTAGLRRSESRLPSRKRKQSIFSRYSKLH